MKHLPIVLLILSWTGGYAQGQSSFPIKVEFGSLVHLSPFGDYQLVGSHPIESEQNPSRPFRLGLYYQALPNLEAGISLVKHTIFETQYFPDLSLVGDSLADTNGNYGRYSQTYESMLVQNFYLSFVLRQRLLAFKNWELKGSLGAVAIRFNSKRSLINQYTAYNAFATTSENNQNRQWAGGVEAGLQLGYRLTDWASLFVRSTFIQGFDKAETASNDNFRLGSLAWGLTVSPNTPLPNSSVKRNTVLLAIGFPLSLSYERLMAIRSVTRHSLRLFIDKYWVYESFPGMAYNVKFGQDKHFFLTEVGVSFSDTYMNKITIGYEYRGPRWLVLRVDGGATFNRFDQFPSIQVHIGRAF